MELLQSYQSIHCAHQPSAECPQPKTIDQYASHQGMAAYRQPLSQLHAAASIWSELGCGFQTARIAEAARNHWAEIITLPRMWTGMSLAGNCSSIDNALGRALSSFSMRVRSAFNRFSSASRCFVSALFSTSSFVSAAFYRAFCFQSTVVRAV